jgi:hypothetical protein
MGGIPLLSEELEKGSAIFKPVSAFAELVYPSIREILPEKKESPVEELLES